MQYKARPVTGTDGNYYVHMAKVIDGEVVGSGFLKSKNAKQAERFARKFNNAPNEVRILNYQKGGGK
jgi:hypothetical protein